MMKVENMFLLRGKREEKSVLVIWRNKQDPFDPVRDKEFIEQEIGSDEYDEILVNGNSLVKGANPLDDVFKENMLW